MESLFYSAAEKSVGTLNASRSFTESLYKLRIRESEKLKTVLEAYNNMEIYHKKAGPDYHRLKTMAKRSIEQNSRMKNFQARNGNYETSAVVRGQNSAHKEFLEIVGNGKLTGSVPMETIAVSVTICVKRATSTQRNPSPRSSTQQSVRNASRSRSLSVRSQSGKNGSTAVQRFTSKELAPLHSVKNGILQNACSASQKRDAGLGRSALIHTARLMSSLTRGLKIMLTKVQWLC